ncbi:MAG: M3 family peptidase, partial [Verrucomicrobiaceae bacterium]
MADSHPFLSPDFNIRWSTLTPDRVVPDITAALEEAERRVDALCGIDRGRMTFENTLLAFEECTAALGEAWGRVGHLDAVCNSPELREAHNQMLPKVSEFFARLTLNESLWDLLKTYSDTPEAKGLAGVRRRFLDETLAEFRQNGADLPADKKQRLEALEAELAQVTQKYGENVLDSTNAWELI